MKLENLRFKNLNWKVYDVKLYNKDALLAEVLRTEDETYKIKWPDGTSSKDCYNLTRAKQHAVQETLHSFSDMPQSL